MDYCLYLISGQILPYFINLIEIKLRTLAELSNLLVHSHLFIKDSTNVSNTVNSLNDVSSYSDVGSLYFLNADVTSFINRAVTGRFFADAYFLTSAGHRQIFSTLNHVVKVMQRTPAGRRWETVRPPPDSLCK